MNYPSQESIEVTPIAPEFPVKDSPKVNIDPISSIQILLALYTLAIAMKNLWRYGKKLWKKRDRVNFKLVIQIVGAIFTVLKAIAQLFNLDDRDRKDEE